MLINVYYSSFAQRKLMAFSTPEREENLVEAAPSTSQAILLTSKRMPVGAASSQAHATEVRDSRGAGCCCRSLPALPEALPASSYPPPACAATAEGTHSRGKGADPAEGCGTPPARLGRRTRASAACSGPRLASPQRRPPLTATSHSRV